MVNEVLPAAERPAVIPYRRASVRRRAGSWFLETGFGPVDDPNPPKFADLDEAQAWIEERRARAS
ncbi:MULTISPECIES: hypothetical protein [unclassified Methylobacterium]|uniref:hypothetical protein n=1 Tax=unclassified Methylobacterium TaxID=2615210 RepID=UPI000A010840|nr:MULTISPECIES: hypothetical protein [Methylobacterium]WFT82998.1 hypothetical protein QA634_14690 [Methylobacterium nodulans]